MRKPVYGADALSAVRPKGYPHINPSDVFDYAKEKGIPFSQEMYSDFVRKYDARGWKNNDGKPMGGWKRAYLAFASGSAIRQPKKDGWFKEWMNKIRSIYAD